MTSEIIKYSGVAVMWLKMISALLLMLTISAMIVWWVFGVSFDTFYMQLGLFFFALFMGIIAAYVGVKVKFQVG